MHKVLWGRLEMVRQHQCDDAHRALVSAQAQVVDLEHKQRRVASEIAQPLQERYSVSQLRTQAAWRQHLGGLLQRGQAALEQARGELQSRRGAVLKASASHRQAEILRERLEAHEGNRKRLQEQKLYDDIGQRLRAWRDIQG